MLELDSESKPIDVVTLYEKLKSKKSLLQEVGGSGYLTDLIESVPTSSNINFYAKSVKEKSILKVSSITENILNCDSFEDFKSLIKEHEGILSKLLKRETAKDLYFKDYSGEIKSLGAWGGDFILAAGDHNTKTYFNNLGYNIVFTFDQLIKS